MTLLVFVTAALAGATYLTLETREQPPAIDAVLADFRHPAASGEVVEAHLPPRLGDLNHQTSYAARLGGVEMVVHAYRDPAGHTVVVYQADRTFPVADGAEHSEDGRTWRAAVEGAVLFCADHPVPSLVVGDDQREVALAARELGLR
jgi:hypothetical protein